MVSIFEYIKYFLNTSQLNWLCTEWSGFCLWWKHKSPSMSGTHLICTQYFKVFRVDPWRQYQVFQPWFFFRLETWFFFWFPKKFSGGHPEKIRLTQPYFFIRSEINPCFQNKNFGYRLNGCGTCFADEHSIVLSSCKMS